MLWNFLKFFLMIMGILTGLHYFLYFSLVNFIPVFQVVSYRRLLIAAITILALSFPVFQLLNHFFGGTLSRFLTGIAGFWFTLSLYLFGLFIFTWVFRFILLSTPLTPQQVENTLEYTALISAAAALLLNIFGLFNALTVKTTRVDVAIKNLPTSWEGKSIMHVSDVHLGGTWGPDRIHQIENIAREEKPEVIVITGDLFDGGSGIHKEFVEGLSALAAVNPPGGIYFTSGNHERYTSYTDSIATVKRSNITLLENDIVDVHGVLFIGVQYPDLRALDKNNNAEFVIPNHPVYKKGKPSVLLYHTPTDFQDGKFDLGDIQRKAYIQPDTNFDHAKSLGIDLQLSGHTHAGQFFPFIGVTRRIYNGYHYGLHRSGDFQIYISSGAGTWGPPIRHTIPCEVALLKLHKDKG